MVLLMFFGDGIGMLVYVLVVDYVKVYFEGVVVCIVFYNNLDLVINLLGVVL